MQNIETASAYLKRVQAAGLSIAACATVAAPDPAAGGTGPHACVCTEWGRCLVIGPQTNAHYVPCCKAKKCF